MLSYSVARTRHSGRSTLRRGDVISLNDKKMWGYNLSWEVRIDICKTYDVLFTSGSFFTVYQTFLYDDYKDHVGVLLKLTECRQYWVVLYGNKKILCKIRNIDLIKVSRLS